MLNREGFATFVTRNYWGRPELQCKLRRVQSDVSPDLGPCTAYQC